ncbi:Non-specific serine/threonine protein kinase [Ascochyta rabiei]|uniref:Non-specific serine/threonine protein kinase n=1 Tax=Didymella rabiei TaxID=5454 RepID=UPI0021FABAF5|nr:Non-specific serine/threonine protein kinase [Ascochyta rabiei]UPX19362.1 Non-specific serine/threonine protein kinase [Ascochyta rabiei]
MIVDTKPYANSGKARILLRVSGQHKVSRAHSSELQDQIIDWRCSIPRYAVLEIMTAQSSTAFTELAILDHLSNSAPEDPNAQHITKLLKRFHHEGPNDNHQCLVFELMGASAASLVEELPENIPKLWGVPQRYAKPVAKKILIHALHGLKFMHKNGVVHGDLQPGNLLFSIENLDEVDQQQLEQNRTDAAIPLRRIDKKTDRWVPRSVYQR